jgi:hypothetical protein
MTKNLIAILGAAALLSGCSMFGGKQDVETGGGGGGEATRGLAGTMADAAVFSKGDDLTAPAECHTSGYMKIDTPAGEPLQIGVVVEASAETCLSVHYLNANGGTQNGGVMEEICSNESPATLDVATLDVTGLEGGSFLQISEAGVCQGATVTITLR